METCPSCNEQTTLLGNGCCERCSFLAILTHLDRFFPTGVDFRRRLYEPAPGDEWTDYTLEVFGVPVRDPLPLDGSWPLWMEQAVERPDGSYLSSFALQVWYARLQRHQSPLYAEFRWTPNPRMPLTLGILGLNQPHSNTHFAAARRASDFLQAHVAPAAGRHPGSGSQYPTPALFIDALHRSIDELLTSDSQHTPTAAAVANKLILSVSRFYDRVRADTGLPWPEYVAQYLEARINRNSQE